MRKAGFTPAAELSFDTDRRVRLASLGTHERARAAAVLLGVPLVEKALAPCWCCNSGQMAGTLNADCWPPAGLEAAVCACAIKRKPVAQAAA